MNDASKPTGKKSAPVEDKARRAAKRSPSLEATPDLEDVLDRGASLRKRRLLRNLRPMLPEILAAGVLQCLVYTAFILNASRSDWGNLAIVCVILLALPFVIALALLGFRRQRNTFTIAIFITFVVFTTAVAFLSGLRIRISYSALLVAYLVANVLMSIANLRLHRSLEDHIALLDFPGARQVASRLSGKVAVITDKNADIGAYDRILIDSKTHHNPEWSGFLTKAYMVGVDVTPWFNFLELRDGRVDVDAFDVSHLAYSPSQIYYSKAKRALDLFAVIITVPLTVPLGFVIWLYIRMLDGGTAIFVQQRRGYGGRSFNMLKFRTMYHGRQGGSTQVNDDRIIRGCRFLRRLRLDELPQLLNIWRGEMSLVGPRPVAEYVAQASEAEEPKFIHRTMVLPGITGWAQVNSGYASTTREEITKLSYDLYYIKHLSFDLDMLIILSTIRTVLFGRGAR
ncbi:sugar transferase [Nitratireductor aquimarinus]|uniref:sugar transferase n=1 Tax=Nitratireductor aquimarinus TaxID=889300 RepID=UPI0029366F53|nr:sugar transferase [Nitratireductor aquimarinus]MDV2966379.1 sugar transferase [Nitratireductor aquimarinus]